MLAEMWDVTDLCHHPTLSRYPWMMFVGMTHSIISLNSKKLGLVGNQDWRGEDLPYTWQVVCLTVKEHHFKQIFTHMYMFAMC